MTHEDILCTFQQYWLQILKGISLGGKCIGNIHVSRTNSDPDMYCYFVQAHKIRERLYGINLLTVNQDTIGKASC